ncbi:HyaD/HybD family hydrogenase maturation endopeptidase [Frankia sp. Cpl3]|uniref:HyaD/HybD family hydrogenase maturation endopeptidase n=1 Tax=Parafrankia colletiae TaxID=573497 RepID=UPI000A04B35F|nr:HyaD/HybD family hydrogenase maturation endopeptidase [Parafrankia colletiae]MCK9902185.1 HyaD/HybD family hydrogenase maturation endopeptidase [Frankia sp. Cpl3]
MTAATGPHGTSHETTSPAVLRETVAAADGPDAPVLVLGIGNELLGDDGVGVVAARRLATPPLPGVDVLDGGTLGLMLMPYLAGRRAVLILDAVATAHGRPGDLVVIPDGDVRRGHGVRATAHDIGLVDALAATELAGCAPRHVALVGVVPESITDRWGLSALLASRVDAMVDAARAVLTDWEVQVPGHA